jgi:hypothetical protein
MAGAEVSLAELGMAGAAFASSTAADVPLAERGMAVVDFASTTVAEVSVAGLITAGAEAACAWRSACSNKVETCSSLVCSCADSTPAAANHLHDHPRNLSDVIRRYAVEQSGDGGHRGVLVEPHEQSLPTNEVAKDLHVEVVCQMGAREFFACRKCRPSASPRAASTKNSARMEASASPPL